MLCHTGWIPPKQQPHHTWPDPLKSSEHNRSRKRGSPTLTGGLSLCPCEAVFTAQLDHFSNTAAWRPSPDAPTAPQVMPILAPEGSQGQLLGSARCWDSEKLGDLACLRLGGCPAGRLSCGGRMGVEQEPSAGATHGVPPPQTHARADEQGSAGGSGDSRLTLPCHGGGRWTSFLSVRGRGLVGVTPDRKTTGVAMGWQETWMGAGVPRATLLVKRAQCAGSQAWPLEVVSGDAPPPSAGGTQGS